MKHFILIITSIVLGISSGFAQTWTCEKIASDISLFNKMKSSSSKTWAERIMPEFPLNNDSEMNLTYVIQCSDSIPRMELVALTEGWLGTVFTGARDQIVKSDEYQIICTGSLGQVAFEQKFIGAIAVIAPIEISVLYKDNRVRLSLLTRNYSMSYANIGKIERKNISIGSTFPYNTTSDHKSGYGMALINTVSKLLNLADGYLSYLNKHAKDNIQDIPEW